MQDLSSFILCIPEVSQSLVPPRAVVLCSPLRLSIIAFLSDDFTDLLPLPTARPGCPVSPVIKISIRKTASLLHSMGKAARMGRSENESGVWGILVHPSSPSCSLSSTNLLNRKDFLQSHTRGRHGLGSDMAVSFGLTTWRCLALKTYQDVSWWEPTFTFIHTRMLFCHVQACTALAGNTQHPSEDGRLLRRSDDSFHSTCPGATATSFPRKFKIL